MDGRTDGHHGNSATIRSNEPDMLSPRGQVGLEAKILSLSSSLALKDCPRPHPRPQRFVLGLGLGLGNLSSLNITVTNANYKHGMTQINTVEHLWQFTRPVLMKLQPTEQP